MPYLSYMSYSSYRQIKIDNKKPDMDNAATLQ
jgi:hypothetical protein